MAHVSKLPPFVARLALPMAIVISGCEQPTQTVLGPQPVVAAAVSPAALSAQSKAFRKQVTVAGIREHQQALQDIANANGGTRMSGLPGYDASALYVSNRMRAAGYAVSFQEFLVTLTGENTQPVLQQTVPTPTTYVHTTDFVTMTYSGSGDVTAAVTPVDVMLPPGPVASSSTSGCEAADFAGFPVGNIALIQRGTCQFRDKVDNAIAAGAVGVIIFNEGQPGRTDAVGGTLNPPQTTVPVVFTSFNLGAALAVTPALTMRIKVDFFVSERTVQNVIAESQGKADGSVVVVGAPLEGRFGAGINQASGATTILEIAEEFAKHDQSARNKMRFIWFGGELGSPGALTYVDGLTAEERDAIELMLEFPELGSPNYVRFVYDPATAPAGSGAVASLLLDFFQGVGQAVEPIALGFSAAPFANVGIPVGGVRSGTTQVKAPSWAAIYGGTAGVALDPCAFQVCDTFSNINSVVLDQLAQGAAHAVITLSKRNFQKEPLVP